MKRKVILYIAMSLDGYITGANESMEFLNCVQTKGEDYGYAAFCDTVDTIIIGRRTYDKVLEMGYDYPHTNKEVYIFTQGNYQNFGNLHYFNGNISELIQGLKQKEGMNIYCDGGAQIANLLLHHNLIDEIILSIIPILNGEGIRLFEKHMKSKKLTLLDSKNYESGLVQLHYSMH